MGNRIGIITQPLFNNYGGIIQNYALQHVLKQYGYNVETINQISQGERTLSAYLKDWIVFLVKPLSHTCPLCFPYRPNIKEIATINQNIEYFINKYISRSPNVVSKKDFKEIYKKRHYDCIIVGSDQCWRPKYNAYIEEMFLDFTEDDPIKRIAYAVSFGTEKWEMSEVQTRICSLLSQKFNLLTVRESSGVDLCKLKLGVKAFHVLDPTMLLDKEDYLKLIHAEEGEINNQKGIFCYILDNTPQKDNWIESIVKESGSGLTTVLPKVRWEHVTKESVKNRIEDCVYPRMTQWLKAFEEAKLVVVDSFHGAVFSIIFNKPFWVLGNEERGNARFDSLLNVFGLEDRFVSTNSYPKEFNWDKQIDWERVNRIWASQKEYSLNLLLRGLSNRNNL